MLTCAQTFQRTTMIKGIQAVEACWSSLRTSHPTDQAQNLIIAQAMGRVTDCYGTVEEIEQTLPADLQILFRKLIKAYFHGYAVNNTPTVNSSPAAIPDRIQVVKSTQKSQADGKPDRVDASGSPPLTDKISWTRRRGVHDFWLTNLHEAETLIIEMPFAE